jgi:hypothetical protein
MTQPTVATKIHQSLDVQSPLATKIALNLVLRLQYLTNPANLALRQIVRPNTLIDPSLRQNLLRRRTTNAIQVGQPNNNPLPCRKVYTRNTSHADFSSIPLRQEPQRRSY